MSDESMLNTALSEGAHDARIVDVSAIPFDPSLRAYCEANACGSYGRNYACPPHVGAADELIARAKGYSRALFFQTVSPLEDSFDVEGMEKAARRHAEVCARIFAAVTPSMARYLTLTAGGCSICPTCALIDGQPCRAPERAISSLEAYCMNVSRLCGKCGMKYINGANTVTYFGMCLFG